MRLLMVSVYTEYSLIHKVEGGTLITSSFVSCIVTGGWGLGHYSRFFASSASRKRVKKQKKTHTNLLDYC